tara:strand:+ start:137 stop:292 length:156 start_codon:yes stop_codon:yes gene_type:complete
MSNYEKFCNKLDKLDISFPDKMILQQAAFELSSKEYSRGFDVAAEVALNHK